MDPSEFRKAGHRIVDLLSDYFEQVGTTPLFPDVTARQLTELFDEPVPKEPGDINAIIDELEQKLLPYTTQVNDPGYFGYITPTPTPAGVLGDLIASAINQNPGLWSIGPAATAMEQRVVRWLNDLIGYNQRAGGNLTSGGTMANFIGLKLARDAISNDRAQFDGVAVPMAAYTSEERHVSVDKAADAVGIGRAGLRIIPTDDNFAIDLKTLEAAIKADRQNGIRPICVIAMGGSTNTGVVDPLADLRSLCDRERIWLHVDCAYGGGMLLSQKFPQVLEDAKLGDSVTIDPHKWFYAPLDAGAILVKDADRLTKSFGMRADYLAQQKEDTDERYEYYAHGFEQSRRFRALKVWMGMKRYGAKTIGGWVDANVDQARRLHNLCNSDPDFVVARKPIMSAICVRYVKDGMSTEDCARLHRAVVQRIEESGRFWFSTTVMKGHTWFRINPVNFRTKLEDMDELYVTLREECARAAL